MQCHKCQYNNKCDSHCLSCQYDEHYKYDNQVYFNEALEKPTQTFDREPATTLPEDIEDRLRIAMCNIFSLTPLELLMLQAIMNGKTLTQFAASVERLSAKNTTCSRHHAFQLRKSILQKYPKFKDALTTLGQRKELKK